MGLASRWLPLLALVLACASIPSTGLAQARRLDVERFVPAPDGDGFLSITGTRTPGPWRWNVGLTLGYAREPLMAQRLDGSRVPIISDRLGADLFFQLGILGRFALVLDAPVALWQSGDASIVDGGGALEAVAIRDLRWSARARILGEDSTEERARHEGEGLAILVGGTVPWGHQDSFAGEGDAQLEAQLLADFHILEFGVGGNAGFRHRFAEPRVLGEIFRNELFFGLGIQIPSFFLDKLRFLVELNVSTDAENPFQRGGTTLVEWLLGTRYAGFRDLELTLAAGSGLTPGVGAPAFRAVAGISFAPRVHDEDHDGIVDDEDECRTLPEDFDSHLDEDGCPEPDNDGDLVPDADDACPNEAADFATDEDEDGCNDPVRDTDGDGIPDPTDACPAQAEDVDGWEDEDGCPDLDDDADGVPDARDRCPREPEDVDGWQDADGCPDLDDDEDGVPDAVDACPRLAEDRDGHQDADGCPDPDDDRDGVLDADDQCADTAETINGVSDEDGCPDRGRGAWRVTGVPGTEAYALAGSLRFARDGALMPGSSGALDQLTRHLRAAWGRRHRIVLGRAPTTAAARVAEALVERGLDGADFDVDVDASVRGVQVTTTGPRTTETSSEGPTEAEPPAQSDEGPAASLPRGPVLPPGATLLRTPRVAAPLRVEPPPPAGAPE